MARPLGSDFGLALRPRLEGFRPRLSQAERRGETGIGDQAPSRPTPPLAQSVGSTVQRFAVKLCCIPAESRMRLHEAWYRIALGLSGAVRNLRGYAEGAAKAWGP